MLMLLLKAEHIHKKFRNKHVLNGVNLDIYSGKLVGVVGENGAGKSTLLKILAGELDSDKGDIMYNGDVGYCSQQPEVNKALTVEEHLDYFKAAYKMKDMSYTKYLLDEFNLHKYKKTLASNLSGGTYQKLNLLLALMHQPATLLLDEPYQGFDWDTYQKFWSLVERMKKNNQAVIIVSHLLYDHRKFDHILQLHKGYLSNESI